MKITYILSILSIALLITSCGTSKQDIVEVNETWSIVEAPKSSDTKVEENIPTTSSDEPEVSDIQKDTPAVTEDTATWVEIAIDEDASPEEVEALQEIESLFNDILES